MVTSRHTLTLSSAATKPASLLKADMTKALYFLWTSSTVCTYIFGSCNKERLFYPSSRMELFPGKTFTVKMYSVFTNVTNNMSDMVSP